MNFDFEKYELERLNIRKGLVWRTIVSILLGVIGLAFLVMLGIPYVFVIAIIVVIIIFATYGHKKSKFLKNVKGLVVKDLIKSELGDDAIYIENGGIPLKDIVGLGVYQDPDRYNLEDYIKASYNGVTYEMCDAKFEERHVTYDSKGNRQVTYETYFSGRVIKIDFKKVINFKMKIIEGHPKGLYTSGYSKVETEVIEFNKKYDLYSTNKEEVYYYMTPLFIQKLLELERLFKGTIQFVMDGDYFYVLINNSVNSLEFMMNRPINQEMVDIIISQINIGAAIINELKMDTDKFNKNIEI